MHGAYPAKRAGAGAVWKTLLTPPRSLAFGATLALCLVMGRQRPPAADRVGTAERAARPPSSHGVRRGATVCRWTLCDPHGLADRRPHCPRCQYWPQPARRPNRRLGCVRRRVRGRLRDVFRQSAGSVRVVGSEIRAMGAAACHFGESSRPTPRTSSSRARNAR